MQPYGVDVVEIIPGSFESGMQNSERLIKLVDKIWYRAPQKLRDEYGKNFNEKGILWWFYISLHMLFNLLLYTLNKYCCNLSCILKFLAKKFTNELQQKIVEHDTTWVIDAYYESIVAKRPKLLYRVGWDVLFL